MRVLLATTTTPDDRKTVACTRALAKSGFWVAVGGDAFWGQAFYTRSLSRRVHIPHPGLGIPRFIEAINEHIVRDHCDVVLPMNDYTTVALTRNRDSLAPEVATALPPAKALDVAGDKLQTQALAQGLGIETPHTFAVKDEGDLREFSAQLEYPCVFKLRRGSGAVGMQVIQTRDQLLDTYQTPRGPSDMAFDREHVLVQEYVPGEVHDACVVCEHGEIRAGLTQKRLRAYPAEGGIGTVVETTQEPELLDRARTLLQALRWHGPAQVEFKIDPQTGRTWLLEINGRFWGSTGVAIRAGINFPLLTCKLALAEDLGSSPEYAVGLRYRFPFPFSLLALAEKGSRRQSLRDFFAPRRDTFSDLMWSDPLPLIAEVLYIGRRAWQRRSLRPVKQRL